jgi:hypothetical protein
MEATHFEFNCYVPNILKNNQFILLRSKGRSEHLLKLKTNLQSNYVFQLSLLIAFSVPLAPLCYVYPPLSHPGSTLLAVITPTDCYPERTFPYRIYVIGC